MPEGSALERRKLCALCEPGHAKNRFVSLELVSANSTTGNQKYIPVTFTVAFEWRETDDVRAGLPFSCVVGSLDECTASIVGNTHDEVKTVVMTRLVKKTANTTTSGEAVSVSLEPLGGGLGKGRSMAQAREEERVETQNASSTTFSEFSKGQAPEWHFRAAPDKTFLNTQRSFTVGIVPEPACSRARGWFHTDTADEIRVFPCEGKSLSTVKKWMILARLRKELRSRPIHVDFRLVPGQSD